MTTAAETVDTRRRGLRHRTPIEVLERLRRARWSLITAFWYRPQFGAIGRGTRIMKPLLIRNPRGIRMGERCHVRDGGRFEVVDRPGLPPARLTLGDRVDIEQGVHIVACDTIEIGDDVCIGARSALLDGRHPEDASVNRALVVSSERSSIVLESNVFLGIGVTVLPNVRIGRNSIVGAGSVVVRDIPPDSIAAGVPARVLRRIDPDRP